MKDNILIIGAMGFIGQNIVEIFLKNGSNLILLTRNLSSIENIFKDNPLITIIEVNLKNTIFIQKIIEKNNVKNVIHLASGLIPSSDRNSFNKELEEVILPTYSLLEYLSEKHIKILFFSSGGTIYGNTYKTKIKEEHTLEPINYYGYGKLMIENKITFLHRTKNLSYLIFRPSNIYGKYQRLESKQGFISVSIGKIISGLPIEIWGDGSVIRDYINVEDVASVTKQFIDMNIKNKVVNIGSGEGTSLNQIIEHLNKNLDVNVDVIYTGRRKVDVNRIILDTTILHSLVDIKLIELKDGIKGYIDYLKVKIEK